MITELEIADLGVIAAARVEFGPGFTAFTGETGAGKTMIVSGLGLLMGGRADPGLIRAGAERATVTGRFADAGPVVAERVEASGGEWDDDELIVTRRLLPGRSRSWVGGAAVPAAVAAEVGAELITIHGQSGQLRLAHPDYQRELLDRFAVRDGKADELLPAYREAYAHHQRLAAELADLVARTAEREREREMLRFGLAEIEQLAPQPSEDVELTAELGRLQGVDDLRAQAQQALTALAGEGDDPAATDVLSLTGVARKALERVGELDPAAGSLGERAVEAATLVADLAAAVSAYLDALDADPARLEWVLQRRADLAKLTRRYGDTVDEVLAWSARAAARVGELDTHDDRLGELRERVEAARAELDRLAGRLTARRRRSASGFADRVAAELGALAMPHARIRFDLTPLPAPGPHGADQVALLFSANPGSEPAGLAKVASGGELSRVRLAIEVVLAGDGDGRCFVFDEVDAGVGGEVAVEIGRRLSRLARGGQVVVVTHLAQVAAFADRHYVVAKADDGRITTSGITELDAASRRRELARMMAGLTDSTTAQAHADELLEVAASGRAEAPRTDASGPPSGSRP